MRTLYKMFGKFSKLLSIGIMVVLITAIIPVPVIAADSSEGGFYISQWTGETWEEIYQHQFQIQYSTEAFTFNVVDEKVVLRIVQVGTPYADIDQISLMVEGEELVPEYARYTGNSESILEDILELDHNVVLAHEQEIEISWDVPGAHDQVTVYLTANEYGTALPFHFPLNGYVTYEMGSNTGSIIVDGLITETDGTVPLYSPFWHPTTGHPDGYTYIYVFDDEQYVYFSLDVTGDNTNEYGEDWAELRILQSDGSEQAFRIDDYDTTWGKAGFGLTSKVSYKHQTYEFAIPKSLIGNENIEFNLAYYGTYGTGVTLVYLGSSGGTINGEKYQVVEPGQYGESVTAESYEGYHFLEWSDGLAEATRSDVAPATGILVVTAYFEIDTFTLTYDTDGNGYIDGTTPQTVDYGSDGTAVEAVPDPGYHFVDWSDSSTDNPRTDTYVTADITVTANFAINPYTVTYYANGGSGTAPTEPNKVAGEEFEIAYCTFDPPTVNQQFKEWNTASDGNGTSYAEYANVTMPANNLDLYAIWEDIIYTVTFDSQGGSAVASQDVVSGDKVTQPADPTRTSYSFGGWYTDEACSASNQWDFANAVVSEDMTLYAKWTLVWSGYENYMTGPENFQLIIGSYAGQAWSAQTFTTESSHTVSGVILRLWRAEEYSGTITASIRATTDSGVPTGSDLCSGTINSSDIAPNRYWNSWYVIPMTPAYPLANGETYAIVVRATGSGDYHCIYWVTVNGGGTYDGGQFWNSGDSGSSWISMGSGIDCFFGIQGDTSYTVSFDSNGGSAVASQGVASGGQATQPADPVLTDYTFGGWFTDEGTWSNQWDFSTVITGDITLYAKWTRPPQAPAITSANSATFTVGTYRSFTVTTTGWPTPAITKTSGSLPTGLSFADNEDGTATLSGTAAAGTGGTYPLQFSATNSEGTGTQNFTLTVRQAPTITTQPSNCAVVVGNTTAFTVVVTGYPEPTFQWQMRTRDGGRWSDIPGATGSTYNTPAATGRMSGYQYQVTVSNAVGSVTSSAATLTVYKTAFTTADVSITKEGSYDSGTNTITWTITVTNDGPGAAQGVMVKDTLSSGTKFISFDPMTSGATSKVGGRAVTVNIGTLANGASRTFKIYALVTRATAPFANTATVTTTSYDCHPEDNVETVTTP